LELNPSIIIVLIPLDWIPVIFFPIKLEIHHFTAGLYVPWFQRLFARRKKREARISYSNVYFPNRFDIFLQMANHMRDSNSESNQVWKSWDLQPMWPEALRSRLSFLSPRKEPLEPGYIICDIILNFAYTLCGRTM
jgi:hypothetical protein